MTGQPKPTAQPEARTADDQARHMLAQLYRADRASRCFPEPREGPDFERANQAWFAIYLRALALGAQFEAEDA